MKCPKCNFDNPSNTRFCGQCGTEFPPSELETETFLSPSSKLPRGSILANRYEIIEEIGSGGMGKVYKAYDKKIEEKIAIKLIRPEIAVDKQILGRFNNELKIARKIVHKNVCRMFDLGEAEGHHFITMEYVSGEDLRSLITRIGQFTIEKTISIAKQICEGLAEAHESGIVHRDLKPLNIMIDNKGNVRIMDFGIARSLYSKRITRTGVSIGTPLYMSPEQADSIGIDQRSDIYSFGIILYEMLTGQVPFEGDTPTSIAFKHKYEKPKNPKELNPHIPEVFNNLILKCIEKDPNKRFQSAKEVLIELDRIESVKLGEKGPNWKKIITRSFLSISALIIIAFVVWHFIIRPTPPTPTIEEYFSAAKNHWNNKQYAEALNCYKAILDLDPENFDAHLNIAHLLKDQEKIDEAIPAYEKTVSLNPDEPQPYKNLGEIYYQRKEYSDSLKYYKDYISRAPPDSPDLDETEEMIRKLEDLVKPEPQPHEPQPPEPKPKPPEPKPKPPEPVEQRIRTALSKAQQAFEAGNYRESIMQLEIVLRLDPKNAKAKNDLKLAKQKLATSEIESLVQEYINALKSNQLLTFYEQRCSPELYEEIRIDAEIISSSYSGFKSEASNQEIRFIDENKAQVMFFNKIIGISKEDGTEQTLFEGTFYWTVVKFKESWRIISLDYKSSESK